MAAEATGEYELNEDATEIAQGDLDDEINAA